MRKLEFTARIRGAAGTWRLGCTHCRGILENPGRLGRTVTASPIARTRAVGCAGLGASVIARFDFDGELEAHESNRSLAEQGAKERRRVTIWQ